jgi:hypothetical protein
MFLHVTKAKYLKDFEIEIYFNNGLKGIADLSEAISGGVFEPLRDKTLFAEMRLDPELATIVWPNGVDFAPEYLFFNTFKDAPEWQDQYKKWGYSTD